jgi:hypothetical protein
LACCPTDGKSLLTTTTKKEFFKKLNTDVCLERKIRKEERRIRKEEKKIDF